MQQPDACTWAGLNISTILKPSKWRHCDPEHCKKEIETFKKSVVWVCKQAAKISIRLEYSNRMLVSEQNWSWKFDGDLPEKNFILICVGGTHRGSKGSPTFGLRKVIYKIVFQDLAHH